MTVVSHGRRSAVRAGGRRSRRSQHSWSGVLRLGHRTEHPVRHRAQVRPMALELVGERRAGQGGSVASSGICMGHASRPRTVTAGSGPVTSRPRHACPWCDRHPIAGAGAASCQELETTTLMTDIPAPGTSRVPSIVPILNPLIRRLLGAGLPFGPNVLLTVRGRRSGEPRTFPVAILELDGRRYVQSPFGEVNWVRNLRAAGEAVVTRGRRPGSGERGRGAAGRRRPDPARCARAVLPLATPGTGRRPVLPPARGRVARRVRRGIAPASDVRAALAT